MAAVAAVAAVGRAVEWREQFAHDGFVAFEGVLSEEEVEGAKDALAELVRRVATDPATKRFGPVWKPGADAFGIQFEKDWVPGFEPGAAHEWSRAELDELELKVRKLMWFVDEDPRLQVLARAHSKVLGTVRALIGDEPILFQDMALIKPPLIGGEKPWHQDNAYFSVAPLDAVCGVWLALDETTVENGCMHMMRGGHKLGALRHHHTYDCEIVSDRVERASNGGLETVAVPLKPGGALFFAGMAPHKTPPNASSDRRRALQFHYRAQSSTIMPMDKYFEVFAEADGSPASCAAAMRRGL
jgi:phytanoyl-CoA hydroxylase